MLSAPMQRLLKSVLVRIKPRGLPAAVPAFLAELRERLAAAGIDATVTLGGSTAKGTFLDNHDVDIFVRFPEDGALSDRLATVLPDAQRVHGSRDYFQLTRGDLTFEIVPVLKVERPDEAKNVTDMSPLHVDYVVRRLHRRPQLADEIRLAKQFCKAARVYGAESHINGVSGHVLDLLILHYGSFTRLLKAVAAWPDNVVIDPGSHHRDPRTAIDRMKHGPLLLVDPIQPDRNAAAALSREQFDRLRCAAKHFLARPTRRAFTRQRLTPALLKARYARRGHRVAVIAMEPRGGKEDVAATKLLKAHEYLLASLRREGFTPARSGWEYDGRGLSWFVLPERPLPPTAEWVGPPVAAHRDAERFRRKHDDVFERDGRLVARVTRRHRHALPFLLERLTDQQVTTRARRAHKV